MNRADLSPLANHLWQSTLFAAFAALLTLALRQNHARVRHAVWLAASCKFLIPLAVLIALGGQIPRRPVPRIAPSNLSIAMDEIGQPFTAPAVWSTLPATARPVANPLPVILWSIWACGFLGIGCSWWVRWRRIRATVRGGSPLDLAIPIRVLSSPTLVEPGIFGVFRPVLLLPEGISGRLSPAQLQAVVAHELCHVRHRDNLIAAIHMFVETLFWFHPLVWWIGKRMVEERERACDEGVVSLGSEPRIYAEAILNVCKLYVESPLVCVSGVTGANLKRRIEAIMTNRTGQKLNRAKKVLLATAGVAVLAVPMVIGLCHGTVAEASAAPFTPEPQPSSFEVASVKTAGEPARDLMFCIGPCTFGERLNVVGSRVDIRFMSLYNLVVTAYRIKPHQLSGPDWMRSQRFDIAAKIPDGVSKDQVPEMLQALLAERFKLSIHRDSKDQAVFALVVGKNGSKLQRSAPEADAPVPEPPGSNPLYTPQGDARQLENGDLVLTSGAYGPMRGGRGASGVMKWEFLKLTMPALAAMLAPHLDRPVVDLTNLQGSYYLASENRPPSEGGARKGSGPPEGGRAGTDGRPPDPFGEGLFRAIEKAGLKLEARKAPVEMIVVDRVEKTPTGN